MRALPDDALAIATIILEAGQEPFEGLVAIGEVIRNRQAGLHPVAHVVFKPWQFSCWNGDDWRRGAVLTLDDQDPQWQQAMQAWLQAKQGSQLTNGATHYFNPDLASPSWAPSLTFLTQIGHHRFYKP